jgi:hypothetical protein
VAATMAGKKYHLLAIQLAEQELIRGLAKRRMHPLPTLVAQSFNIIKAAAANNAKNRRLTFTFHSYFLKLSFVIFANK